MSFNTNKTVCMVANPYDKSRYVSQCFPQFTLANCKLSYVPQFKYLGHIIEHTFCDDSDVNRELRNLFARVNVLIRRFSYCSTQVKLKLFKSYCLCYYDIALWQNYHVSVGNKLTSAYVSLNVLNYSLAFRNMVVFSAMLMQLNLPSFNTVLHNARVAFLSEQVKTVWWCCYERY